MALIDDVDLLIHMGSNKTGSSSIQSALSAEADALAASDPPILYPRAGRPKAAHFPLGKVFTPMRTNAHQAAFADFVREAGAFRGKCVISAETFSQTDAHEVAAAFEAAFPGRRIGVICYGRPIPGLALSHWNQIFKRHWSSEPLDAFVRKVGLRDLLPEFDRWAEAFPGRFWLGPFVQEALSGGDVVRDFSERVFGAGHPLVAPLTRVPRANTSEDAGWLLLLERAKPAAAAALAKVGIVPPARNNRVVRRMIRRISEHVPESRAKLRYSSDLLEALVARSRAFSRHVDSTFFGQPYFEDSLEAALATTPPGTELLTAEEALSLSPSEVQDIVDDVTAATVAFFQHRPDLAAQSRDG